MVYRIIDGNGIVDGFTDNDGDGFADSVAAARLPEPDSDGDGFLDYLDLDSDNDGLPDVTESLGPQADINNDGLLDNPIDSDNNGLVDGIAFNSIKDTDGDQQADHLDLDSDNDGVKDLVQAGGADIDGDGQVDTWLDSDSDGIPNTVDVDFTLGEDVDNDGIDDSADATFIQQADSDGDGIVDSQDADFQGDGFVPFTAVVAEQLPALGAIRIGLEGSGCSIAGPLTVSSTKIDPTLPGLALLSMLWFGLRRPASASSQPGTSSRRAGPAVLLIAASVFLPACSLMDRQSSDAGSVETGAAFPERTAGKKNGSRNFTRHVYAATGLGASWLEPDTSEVDGVDVNDRVNAGGQIAIGADVTKHLSLELHSADLGSAGLSPGGRINYRMHGGSALVYAGKNRHQHARSGLSAYGRVGVGVLDDSAVGQVDYIEENNAHVLFGGGLEYGTNLGLALRAEVISFDADVRYGQLGLLYRIGGKHKRKPIQIAQAPTPEPFVVPTAAPVVTAVQRVQEPVEIPYDPCEQFNGVLEGVNFHTDSARLTDSAQAILNSVANSLALCETTPVSIAAHTDNQGSDEYNQQLSKNRARSVARYLSTRGIAITRMSARAYGESRPIQSNNTADGRAQNRRVELVAR